MSSLKKFDYRIKDNRKRNIFLCGIVLVVITIVGVKLFNSYATFSNETTTIDLASGNVVIPATHYLKELAKSSTNSELRYDQTIDNNLRYLGKNPNNYVDFGDGIYDTDIWYGFSRSNYMIKQFTNSEDCQNDPEYYNDCAKIYSRGDPILWRIIGVMNNVEDESGNKDMRIKLIRADGIGQISWDSPCLNVKNEIDTNNCLKMPNYSNNWEKSTLQRLLNEAYLNSKKSTEYNHWTEMLAGYNFGNSVRHYEKIDFTKTGIKQNYRDMIDIVKYNLGGLNNVYTNLTAKEYYDIERSDNVYPGNPTEWIGKIGLMYPSDYGFATSGGYGIETESEEMYTVKLETCMSVPINDWKEKENVGCRDNNWLSQKKGTLQWTISQYVDYEGSIMFIRDDSSMDFYDALDAYLIRPVVYLKPFVKIVSGTGTKSNPYKLAL